MDDEHPETDGTTPTGTMNPTDEESTPLAELDEALEKIEARGSEIRDAQLEQALEQLRATGTLTSSQQAAVRQLSKRLVEQLLAVPQSSLCDAVEAGDTEATETVIELFGADGYDR